jgi:BirA family transcriptional regulator, biotin operon repressor / biotin---[acetyl-CoA-carboxylase] ligase
VVQSLHPDLRLKWPNDVWLHDRKMAGILIETASLTGSSAARYAVVGVGINIRARHAAGLVTPPAWLQEVLPALDAPQALACVVAPLVAAIQAFEVNGFAPFKSRFNERDALGGVPVRLSDGVTGVAQGVDDVGALQVLTLQGLKKITSAEVSVRPVAAAPC